MQKQTSHTNKHNAYNKNTETKTTYTIKSKNIISHTHNYNKTITDVYNKKRQNTLFT